MSYFRISNIWKNDELVPEESILNLEKRLKIQKNIEVKFDSVTNGNHFFKGKEKILASSIENYLKEKKAII